jgi:hypothetical protein
VHVVTHQDVGVNSQVVFAGSVVEQVEKVMSVIIVDTIAPRFTPC